MFWQAFAIAIVALFIIVLAYRIISIKRLPVHLRWELMPVPHEKGRSHYGGSYLEEYEWWRKPRQKSFFSPIKYMVVEIFLLRTIWKNNRTLWPLSLSFHLGIYLVILTTLLSIISGIFSSPPSALLNTMSGIALAGYILGGLGAVALILRRVIDTSLRAFSSVPTYFNLILLLAVFTTGIISWVQPGSYGSDLRVFSREVITFGTDTDITATLAIHVILSLLFLLYLPWTNMTHFIIKYFTYHDVRWDDNPQDIGLSRKINNLVNQTVKWSSPHIGTDDRRTWLDTIGRQ